MPLAEPALEGTAVMVPTTMCPPPPTDFMGNILPPRWPSTNPKFLDDNEDDGGADRGPSTLDVDELTP